MKYLHSIGPWNFNIAKTGIVLFLFYILTIGCTRPDTIRYEVVLPIPNYRIVLDLPSDFDTMISWEQISDYHCGDMQHYRFQGRNLPIDLESGFFNLSHDIEIRQLTVSHILNADCALDRNGRDGGWIYNWLNQQMRKAYEEDTTTHIVTIDSILINNQWFGRLGLESNQGRSTPATDRILQFATIVSDQPLAFQFHSNIPSDTGFLADMDKAFRTIRIEPIEVK